MTIILPAGSGAPRPVARHPSENEALIREQFASLTQLIPILYVVLFFDNIILSWTFRNSASPYVIFGIPALCFAFITGRFFYWVGMRNKVQTSDLTVIKRAMRSTKIMGPGLALLFTVLGLLLMRNGDTTEQSLAVLSIWVAASASAFCLYALPSTAIIVLLCSCVPLCCAFLISGNPVLMMLTPIFVTLSGLMIYMLRQNFKSFAVLVNSRSKLEETRQLSEAAKIAATEIANTDALTGLANRRFFDRQLVKFAEKIQKNPTPAFVAMIDLDGFKPINDMYGHGVGDHFLAEVARRLKNALGNRGLVARMGGDEFAVLVEGISDANLAKDIGEQLVSAIDRPFRHEAILAHMRASCGIAMHCHSDSNAKRLVTRADLALYSAKASSRGGVVLFNDSLEDEARIRAQIEQGLRSAIAEKAFEVHYQPIVDIKTGETTGFEALARWTHPEIGPVSPAVFIPIAEQIGVIDQLTALLLFKAASRAATWPSHLMLSFNLSASLISSPSAGLNIISIISAAGLAPHRLDVEVTETALMQDVDAARQTIVNLKNVGVHVSLDDFGTGYSSFSQLCDLPLDTLKIDKSFIDRICTDTNAVNVVRAIIGMCNNLQLKCLAEGIEHEEQLKLLEKLGCHSGQGYIISRPVPHEEVRGVISAPQAVRLRA